MDENNTKYYGYIEPGEDMHYFINKDGFRAGFNVGIIVLPAWFPCQPGHVTNATTFHFPVKYEEARQSSIQSVVKEGSGDIVDGIIDAAKKLERDGCRVIIGDCGYFGHYQKKVAASVEVPVYMSGIIQVPIISIGLKPEQKIGILCADGPNLTFELFQECGVSKEDYERCIIYGAQDQPEFSKVAIEPGNLDTRIIRKELVGLAEKMVKEHPEIGAILLECTDMPPYAASIQAATSRPVFDTVTLINYLYHVVSQRHYGGFI